jgi:hypothetical protein
MTQISLIVPSLAQLFSDEAKQRLQIARWFGIAAAYNDSAHAVRHTSAVVPETALVLSSNMSLGQDWQVIRNNPTHQVPKRHKRAGAPASLAASVQAPTKNSIVNSAR